MTTKSAFKWAVYLGSWLMCLHGISYSAELEVSPSAGAVMQGKDEGPENRVLLRFGLSSLPKGSRIDNAFLVLPVKKNPELATVHPLRVTSLTSSVSFSSGHLSYSDLETLDSLSSVVFLSDASLESAKADVTEIVSSWIKGGGSDGSFVVAGLDGMGQSVLLSSVSPEDVNSATKLVVRFTRVLAE